MNLDMITAIIAIVAALASPIVTTFLNNRHQNKMKRLELIYQQQIKQYTDKRETCESFIQFTCDYIAHRGSTYRAKFDSSRYRIMLYLSPDLSNKINRFASDLETASLLPDSAALQAFYPIVQEIANEIGGAPKAPR